MGPCLRDCKGKKVFIKLQSDHFCFFGSKQSSKSCKHSNNLRMSFYFIQKTVKCCHISLGPIVWVYKSSFFKNICSIIRLDNPGNMCKTVEIVVRLQIGDLQLCLLNLIYSTCNF